MEEYEGQIRLILKNYPYKYRDYSRFAAEALLAAGDQGKYWEMHDLLFEHSPTLDPKSLNKYAEELGLDMARFRKDLEGMKHKEVVDGEVALAESLDIYNTPTYFINGKKVIGNAPYEHLKKIIEKELNRVQKKDPVCSQCHNDSPADP
jgi:protein-disulfide isomerase